MTGGPFSMERYLREWGSEEAARAKADLRRRFRNCLVMGYSPQEIYTLMDGHYRREGLAETIEAAWWERWFCEYFDVSEDNGWGRIPEDEE